MSGVRWCGVEGVLEEGGARSSVEVLASRSNHTHPTDSERGGQKYVPRVPFVICVLGWRVWLGRDKQYARGLWLLVGEREGMMHYSNLLCRSSLLLLRDDARFLRFSYGCVYLCVVFLKRGAMDEIMLREVCMYKRLRLARSG